MPSWIAPAPVAAPVVVFAHLVVHQVGDGEDFAADSVCYSLCAFLGLPFFRRVVCTKSYESAA